VIEDIDRREAIRRGLIAGAALSAGFAPALLGAPAALAQEQENLGDRGIIQGAIGLEQALVVAYQAAAQRKLLGRATPVAKMLVAQEQAHIATLTKALAGLGGKVPQPPLSDEIAGFKDVQSSDDMLNFAHNLESQAVAAYIDASKALQDSRLLRTVAEIIASEGQHLVILRQALGNDPVPTALPTGTETS
jgi:hypothetical protein